MNQDGFSWRVEFQRRPWWMNILFVWCLVLAIGVPIELVVRPLAEDVEVLFGIEFTGLSAKAAGVLHWAIFLAGARGFWKMASWMWPWAAVYVFQVALAHLVWSELSAHGSGWPIGLLQAVVISGIAVLLWRARLLFQAQSAFQTSV